MYKKYIPLFILLVAAFVLLYVKTHQRGHYPRHDDYAVTDADFQGFNRKAGHLVYSKHARCRMDCRHIDESEVQEILEKGAINYDKIEKSDKGKTYPLEGYTHDKQHVRIVFAPKPDEIVVVTVIDLDTEWSCDCK